MDNKANLSDMVSIGLTEEEIAKIGNVFARHDNIERVILYGSRAMGTFKPASDIDLTLFGPNITLTQLNELETELDDLYLPWKFDLSVFNQIDNDELLDHINRTGKVFFEKPQ